ncbi:MAG: YdcF family protein, partial [Bacteroidetes bacterium]|nr:YdcF family protein [Bacteroidota bacterium]
MALVNQTIAQNQLSKNSYQLVRGNSFVTSKNYYFLTLVNTIPEVSKQLASDTALQRIQLLRKNNFKKALDNCKLDITCLTAQLQFSEDEISEVGKRLRQLYTKDNYLGKLIRNHIIPSGTYYQFNQLEEKEILVKAWEQDARGINFCIGVYAEGKKPN